MNTYLPRPAHPTQAELRGRCGTPSAKCGGDIRPYPTGWRCERHSPANVRRWVERQQLQVVPS